MPALDQFRQQWRMLNLICRLRCVAPLPALVRHRMLITSDPQPLDAVHYVPLFCCGGVAVAKADPLAGDAVQPEHCNKVLITYPVERADGRVLYFLDPADVTGGVRRGLDARDCAVGGQRSWRGRPA